MKKRKLWHIYVGVALVLAGILIGHVESNFAAVSQLVSFLGGLEIAYAVFHRYRKPIISWGERIAWAVSGIVMFLVGLCFLFASSIRITEIQTAPMAPVWYLGIIPAVILGATALFVGLQFMGWGVTGRPLLGK
ncbi:MAG: hypothetical protein PHT44_02080 [Candidatus Portnoybacteria bacterium]|nr:hypothetical protein [Candidatus Portnoybacteria bacterium]MDD4982618.1 hypothetical protein [Candidatus Portnoybacteria bacterium]